MSYKWGLELEVFAENEVCGVVGFLVYGREGPPVYLLFRFVVDCVGVQAFRIDPSIL